MIGSVVCIGSCVVDVAVEVPHLPAAAESLVARNVATGIGGKASNTAIGVARLGTAAHIVARVGGDYWGDEAIKLWQEHGVGVDRVVREAEATTGVGIVCVSDTGENFTVSALGANARLHTDDIHASRDLFAGGGVCVAHLNAPAETISLALRLARERGCTTVLNASPIDNSARELLALADVCVLNASEASELASVPIRSADDAVMAARSLIGSRRGAACLVTLGERGVVAVQGDRNVTCSYRVSEVRDTTGAGDALVAALSAELARGQVLAEAVDFAAAAAAVSVQRAGTWSSMPTRVEVEMLRGSRT
jgi:ribokinase